MPTRTPHTGVAGEVLTAANLAKYPKGLIGYAKVTSNQAGISTPATDVTGLTVTVTVGADRLLRVSAQVQVDPAAFAEVLVTFVQDGTTIGRVSRVVPADSLVVTVSGFVLVPDPAAGSIVFKIQAETDTSTITTQASAAAPAWIAVEDLGPAF